MSSYCGCAVTLFPQHKCVPPPPPPHPVSTSDERRKVSRGGKKANVPFCDSTCRVLFSPRERSVATFPKPGNGPVDDDSVRGRLKGLKWLATDGKSLPAGVERVLVMDATDLQDLPLSNDDPNLPAGVDVEEFWKADGRKPSRILLRHVRFAIVLRGAAILLNRLSFLLPFPPEHVCCYRAIMPWRLRWQRRQPR